MWDKRIGMLKEGDEDKPMVDPEVGDEVHAEHGCEAEGSRPDDEGCEPEEETDDGDQDLVVLVRGEERWGAGQVVDAFGVTFLAGGVGEDVCWPADDLGGVR